MDKKQLVIFGCGYVGTALAKYALEQGWAVWALTRNEARIRELLHMGVSTVQARTDEAGWERVLPESCEGAIYCASSASRSVEGYRESYVDGQIRALEWAGTACRGHYIYTSSTSVYGDSAGGWIDEVRGPWSDTPYARVLREAESLVAQHSSSYFVYRLAGIYGLGRHLLWDRVAQMEGDSLPGYGDTYLNLIHLDDIVSALWTGLLANSECSGVYNVADGAPATRQQIVNWCAEQLGKSPIRFDPSLANEDSRAARFSGGRRPNRRVAIEKIKEELSWSPTYADFKAGYQALGLTGVRGAQP